MHGSDKKQNTSKNKVFNSKSYKKFLEESNLPVQASSPDPLVSETNLSNTFGNEEVLTLETVDPESFKDKIISKNSSKNVSVKVLESFSEDLQNKDGIVSEGISKALDNPNDSQKVSDVSEVEISSNKAILSSNSNKFTGDQKKVPINKNNKKPLVKTPMPSNLTKQRTKVVRIRSALKKLKNKDLDKLGLNENFYQPICTKNGNFSIKYPCSKINLKIRIPKLLKIANLAVDKDKLSKTVKVDDVSKTKNKLSQKLSVVKKVRKRVNNQKESVLNSSHHNIQTTANEDSQIKLNDESLSVVNKQAEEINENNDLSIATDKEAKLLSKINESHVSETTKVFNRTAEEENLAGSIVNSNKSTAMVAQNLQSKVLNFSDLEGNLPVGNELESIVDPRINVDFSKSLSCDKDLNNALEKSNLINESEPVSLPLENLSYNATNNYADGSIIEDSMLKSSNNDQKLQSNDFGSTNSASGLQNMPNILNSDKLQTKIDKDCTEIDVKEDVLNNEIDHSKGIDWPHKISDQENVNVEKLDNLSEPLNNLDVLPIVTGKDAPILNQNNESLSKSELDLNSNEIAKNSNRLNSQEAYPLPSLNNTDELSVLDGERKNCLNESLKVGSIEEEILDNDIGNAGNLPNQIPTDDTNSQSCSKNITYTASELSAKTDSRHLSNTNVLLHNKPVSNQGEVSLDNGLVNKISSDALYTVNSASHDIKSQNPIETDQADLLANTSEASLMSINRNMPQYSQKDADSNLIFTENCTALKHNNIDILDQPINSSKLDLNQEARSSISNSSSHFSKSEAIVNGTLTDSINSMQHEKNTFGSNSLANEKIGNFLENSGKVYDDTKVLNNNSVSIEDGLDDIENLFSQSISNSKIFDVNTDSKILNKDTTGYDESSLPIQEKFYSSNFADFSYHNNSFFTPESVTEMEDSFSFDLEESSIEDSSCDSDVSLSTADSLNSLEFPACSDYEYLFLKSSLPIIAYITSNNRFGKAAKKRGRKPLKNTKAEIDSLQSLNKLESVEGKLSKENKKSKLQLKILEKMAESNLEVEKLMSESEKSFTALSSEEIHHKSSTDTEIDIPKDNKINSKKRKKKSKTLEVTADEPIQEDQSFEITKNVDLPVYEDPRYLYFVKKICNVNRRDSEVYCKEHEKLRNERADKSVASIPCFKKYTYKKINSDVKISIDPLNNDYNLNESSKLPSPEIANADVPIPNLSTNDHIQIDNNVDIPLKPEINSEAKSINIENKADIDIDEIRNSEKEQIPSNFTSGNESDTKADNSVLCGASFVDFKPTEILLQRLSMINNIICPEYDKDTFELLVFKYGENLNQIAKLTQMDIKDVILVYYLNYYANPIDLDGSLLEKYVESEWPLRDQIIFEDNFFKYGSKFNKYMMNKSIDELRIFYRYYLKRFIPENWTEEDRTLFSILYENYRKDWNSLAQKFKDKTVDDLKSFYHSYYKKLDDVGRAKEGQLVEIDLTSLIQDTKKKSYR